MKRVKLPNGFGSITKLKRKNIRNPYFVRICVGKTPEGRPILRSLKPKAYFSSYNDAYMALVKYHENPLDLFDNKTIGDYYWQIYNRDGILDVYKTAWNYCSGIENIPIRQIQTRHVKYTIENGVFNGHTAPPTIKKYTKSLLSLIFDEAIQEDMVQTNYARLYKIPKSVSVEIKENKKDHIAFTEDELNILWNRTDLKLVDMILVQCYSGWRPNELCKMKISDVDLNNWTFTGGSKTEAGKNRVVPIHENIRELVKNRYEHSCSEYLFNYEKANGDVVPVSYSIYNRAFTKNMNELDMDHRPHDPRKTFVTLAKKYSVDEYAIKYIVGHYIEDLTERIYTDRDIDWLTSEINKIQCTNGIQTTNI